MLNTISSQYLLDRGIKILYRIALMSKPIDSQNLNSYFNKHMPYLGTEQPFC